MTKGDALLYSSIGDVPRDVAYPAIWRVRGFTIRPGEQPIAWLVRNEYGKIERYPLYGYSQLTWLRGKKAAIRRAQYIVWLYREDAQM